MQSNISKQLLMVLVLAATVGCSGMVVSVYREHASSSIAKPDGSRLDVECLSNVQHTVSSVNAKLGGEPQVVIIKDDREFTVTAKQVTLNGEPYATVPADASKVTIQISEEGFTVSADGRPIGPDEPDS
ncbi:MAG: hypothetical protein AAGF31_06745 [Planctomycetota bacterium]